MIIEASTLQFNFPDVDKAIKFYTTLFGRSADFVTSPHFQEWEVFPNFWLQITTGDRRQNPVRLRFGVQDVKKYKLWLEDVMDINVTDQFYTQGVVLLYNFEDPWGYRLGIFQDLQRYPLKAQD